MKNSIIFIGLLVLVSFVGLSKRALIASPVRGSNPGTPIMKLGDSVEIKNGDLIFQTSLSAQSKAIQIATKSKYSHCGLVYKEGNNFNVLEAVQPVKKTSLDSWIARGQNGKFVIKILKIADQVLTPATF